MEAAIAKQKLRAFMRVGAVSVAAVAGATCAMATGMPVVDASRNVAVGFQLAESLKVYENMGRSLRALRRISANLRLDRWTQGTLTQIDRLTTSTGAIGHNLEHVFRQFETMFPDRQQVARYTPEEQRALAGVWERELLTTSVRVGNMHSTLQSMKETSERSERILSASTQGGRDDGSKVAALQGLNQALATLSQTSSTLVQAVSVNARQKTLESAKERATETATEESEKKLYKSWSSGWSTPGLDPNMYGGR